MKGRIPERLKVRCIFIARFSRSSASERSLPCSFAGQQLFAGFKRRFDMSRHHFLQALHQIANVFHAHPRKPRGI